MLIARSETRVQLVLRAVKELRIKCEFVRARRIHAICLPEEKNEWLEAITRIAAEPSLSWDYENSALRTNSELDRSQGN